MAEYGTPNRKKNGSEKSSEKPKVNTEKSSEKILSLISENPSITTADLADRIGISTRAVEKHLANLKAKGRLLRIGPDKGGHWEVARIGI